MRQPNASFGAIVFEIGEQIDYLPAEEVWVIEVVNHPFIGAVWIEAKTVQALLDTEIDEPVFIENQIRLHKLEFGVAIGTAEVVEFPKVLGIKPVLHRDGTRH